MADGESRFSIDARFDKRFVGEDRSSVRYLVVDVKTDEVPAREQPTALNLALVIDVSTSMIGNRLSCAKLAALSVIRALKDTDYLSIVSFGHDVCVHVDSVKLDAVGKEAARSVIETLDHRIYTNLSGGWLKGAECVARLMEERPDLHGHIVLLSDGYANRGILSPRVLEEHADQLRIRGVRTSTVGIGDDYSSTLLLKLAEYGGGRMHDAQHPAEITEVVMGELHELSQTYIEDLTLELDFPSGVKIENLSCFPDSVGISSLIARMGSLSQDAARRIVLRVEVPDKGTVRKLQFKCTVGGTIPGSKKLISKTTGAALKHTSRKLEHHDERDEEISVAVAEAWHASIVRRASELNRSGDYPYLKRFLEHELKYFSRYCAGLPFSDRLVAELSLLWRNANIDWQERLRKEMELTSYQFQTTTLDYRPFVRGKWSETMQKFID